MKLSLRLGLVRRRLFGMKNSLFLFGLDRLLEGLILFGIVCVFVLCG